MSEVKSYRDLVAWQKSIELARRGACHHHRKEYVQFLGIGKRSLAELQTYFVLAEKLQFVGPAETEELV
jgi:four helix bundle protein